MTPAVTSDTLAAAATLPLDRGETVSDALVAVSLTRPATADRRDDLRGDVEPRGGDS